MERSAFWDSSDYIRITLTDFEVEARVGMHPWEQHPERPTRLLVNIEMFAHVAPGEKVPFIDYDDVRKVLRKWPLRPHTVLLETLVEEVIGECFRNPLVEACRVSVVKPDIFNEAKAAGAELYRLNPRSRTVKSGVKKRAPR